MQNVLYPRPTKQQRCGVPEGHSEGYARLGGMRVRTSNANIIARISVGEWTDAKVS
jgi:hypothetical protein